MAEDRTDTFSMPEPASEVVETKESRFLFDRELEQLLLVADAVLAGKKISRQEIFPEPPADPDSKKEKVKQSAPADPTLPPTLILIGGSSGIGKTALLEAFAEQLPQACEILSCHEGWTSPFHLLEDLLLALKAKQPQFDRLLDRSSWGLGPFFPELFPDFEGPAVGKQAFFAALAGVLLEVARQRPLALVIDDLTWADPAVVEFMAFLERSLAQTRARETEEPGGLRRRRESAEPGAAAPPRLLVVASYVRDEVEGDPIRELLHNLEQESFTANIDLADLDRQAIGRFIVEAGLPRLTNGAAARFCEAADRTTLTAQLLCRILVRREADGDGAALPARAEALKAEGVVRTALTELPERLRNLVSVLALFRRPVSEDVLLRVVDFPAAELHELLEQGRGLEFLRASNAGWSVANALCATEAQQLFTPTERSQWNDRVARTLPRGAGEPPSEADYAFFQHAVRGTEPALARDVGLRAAEFLRRNFAYQRSLVVLYNLLGLIQTGEHTPREITDITRQIVDLEEAIGRTEAAKQNLKRLFFEQPEFEEEERADLLIRLARLYQKHGRHSRSLKILGRAFGKKLGETTTARIYGAIASVRLDRNESKKALNYCLRGIGCLPKDQASPTRVELRELLSRIYRVRGDNALAVDSLLQALEAGDRSGYGQDSCPILDQLGKLYLEQGNYFRAARYLYRSLEMKTNGHDLPGLAASYTALGDVYSRSGNFAKAIEEQRKASEIHELLGDWGGLGRNLLDLGNSLLRLGTIGDAVSCLRNAISVAEKSGRTEELVAAFASLAEAYLFLGDTKQAENLLRQVEILAQEFGLRMHLARGQQLGGAIAALRRNWDDATKRFQKARDLYASLGLRYRETETKLDLAALAFDRELLPEALKTVTQAQVTSDELRSPQLVARASMIKGNIYRLMHPSGRPVRWRESLDRALDVARSVADVSLHFDILYSFGRAFHYDQAFELAESRYRQAQEILDRIAGNLDQDEAMRFWADKRRQLFREDYDRLRRENGTRVPALPGYDKAPESGAPALSSGAYEDLLGKVSRLNSSTTHENFHSQVLGLALDLTKAERGFLVEVSGGAWQYAAFLGLRPEVLAGALSYAETLVAEVLRRKASFATSAKDEEEKYGSRANLAGFRDRIAILMPIMSGGEVLGVLYLDRQEGSENGFLERGETLLGQFAAHAAVAWENRRTFLSATTWPGTPFLVEPYFVQVVREAKEQHRRGGNALALLGIRLGASIGDLADGAAREIEYLVGHERRVGALHESVLVVLVTGTTPKDIKGFAQDFLARLRRLVIVKGYKLLIPETPEGTPVEWFRQIKDLLSPSSALVEEIQSLASSELGLREAKQLLEKHVILKALKQANGNITRAAQVLGVHRPQLSQLVRKHDLRREALAPPIPRG